jgi:hypothetical protein
VVDDVISTGRSMLAQLVLLAKADIEVAGIVTAMQESRAWHDRLAASDRSYPDKVHSVLRSPLFRRCGGGWMPDPSTYPEPVLPARPGNYVHV